MSFFLFKKLLVYILSVKFLRGYYMVKTMGESTDSLFLEILCFLEGKDLLVMNWSSGLTADLC